MDGECKTLTCPYREEITETRDNTAEILRIMNGHNGDKGMKTRMALLEAWMEMQKQARERWTRALVTVAVTLAVSTIIAIVIAAAKGIIKL
jgi:hypothetical protein